MIPDDSPGVGSIGPASPRPEAIDEATVATLARRIDEAMEQALLHILSYATDLALAAAEAIVNRAAATDPRVLERSLGEGLRTVTDLARVDLHVNPADAPLARDLCGRLRHGPSAVVSPDPAVARGGCLVVTDFGEVDATIEGQLRRLAEGLLPDDRSNAPR